MASQSEAAIIGAGGPGPSASSTPPIPTSSSIVAFSDIRPSNQKRARQALESKYGSRAARIELLEDYHKLLDRDDIEMVIIALPLHLHAPASIEALQKGKHVLCEKLMAKTVLDSKRMVRAARKTGKLLAIGHQRHYSYLYANALEIARQKEILGDIRHIRAFWHRNQTGGGKPGAETGEFDGWYAKVPPEDRRVDFARYGYKSVEELVRWRLHARTGAGLMAELGSHQLDASSILLSAILGTKAHPLAVSGVGVNSFFRDDREVEDHIFLTYEFPRDIIVTYSSITTNELESYGEQVMGTRGTLAILAERDVYLFKEKALKDTRITWAEKRIAQPVATSTSTVAVDCRRRNPRHPGQPGLPRGTGTPGLAHPPSRPGSAPLPRRGRPRRCRHHPGLEPGHAPENTHPVQTRVVRPGLQRHPRVVPAAPATQHHQKLV